MPISDVVSTLRAHFADEATVESVLAATIRARRKAAKWSGMTFAVVLRPNGVARCEMYMWKRRKPSGVIVALVHGSL
jgi:hypothetical protein